LPIWCAELAGSGGHAKGYASDLTDPAAVKAAIASIQGDLGPVDLLFWNAAGYGAGLLTATPDKTVNAFNCTVTGGPPSLPAQQLS
jgi:NAD(P)-dependent dehydrogenase (short-subunit alcohol dehydrogenase family)